MHNRLCAGQVLNSDLSLYRVLLNHYYSDGKSQKVVLQVARENEDFLRFVVVSVWIPSPAFCGPHTVARCQNPLMFLPSIIAVLIICYMGQKLDKLDSQLLVNDANEFRRLISDSKWRFSIVPGTFQQSLDQTDDMKFEPRSIEFKKMLTTTTSMRMYKMQEATNMQVRRKETINAFASIPIPFHSEASPKKWPRVGLKCCTGKSRCASQFFSKLQTRAVIESNRARVSWYLSLTRH